MIGLTIPMAFGKLVDMAVKGDMSQLPLLTMGMAGLFGISALLDYYSDYISDFLAHTIIRLPTLSSWSIGKIRNNTFKVILNQDVGSDQCSTRRCSFTTPRTLENSRLAWGRISKNSVFCSETILERESSI